MLVNCLIGRRLKAPRAAVPIKAGPTTGMPMVILALDMAPPAQQAAPSCSRSGSTGGAFTPALPAAYAPPHVDTRGRTGGNAVPSPANCAVKPGVAPGELEPPASSLSDCLRDGLGRRQLSGRASHEQKHQRGHRLSGPARSAAQKQHDDHDDSDEDNCPNADIHDRIFPSFESPGFPAFPRRELPGPGTARLHGITWLPCVLTSGGGDQ
jgi:hypothetical protein